MPSTTYDALPSTVQAYKKAHGIGRFDPSAPALAAQKAENINAEISSRGIETGKRCRLLPASTDGRRGLVAFVGEIEELPGVAGAKWVGIRLDEPVGRNDGTVEVKGGTAASEDNAGGRKRYFEAGKNCGVFVRPEKVEVGDFPAVDDLDEELGSDMEEI